MTDRTANPATDETPNGPLTRGHKKKARTRARLIDAAVRVIAQQGEAFTIGQITAEAGVAHGTFYNYFDDRDAVIDAVVPEVLGGIATSSGASVTARDPAVRFATITAIALQRAAETPERVRVVLRLDAVHDAVGSSPAFDQLRADIAVGAATGRFSVDADGPTIDVVVGAMIFAARRITDGDVGDDYVTAVVAQLLRSLGLSGDEAVSVAERAVVVARSTPVPRA
ncbi:MAG: TetR/AcrR family transcriptional regulator [Ilumatobacteraceae bacterium]